MSQVVPRRKTCFLMSSLLEEKEIFFAVLQHLDPNEMNYILLWMAALLEAMHHKGNNGC